MSWLFVADETLGEIKGSSPILVRTAIAILVPVEIVMMDSPEPER